MARLALLLSALLAAAPEDLSLREGSGWAGFKAGTSIKTRTSFVGADGKPSISVATQRLKSAAAGLLTIEQTTKNVLGEEETSSFTLPDKGEAGAGEKESAPEALGEEKVEAAGASLVCEKRRVTVTGPAGRRVVTTWTSKEPKALVKRIVETQTDKGARVSTESWLLTGLSVPREVNGVKIRCLSYKTLTMDATGSNEGETLACRDIPSGTVRMARTFFRDGKKVGSVLVELLDFDLK